jgi:acetylornithine/succinyldiaminopimelate/putrescine aminotransferase
MEAAEFGYRLARVATGRSGAVGFARSMHGKSLAMSSLGWCNPGAAEIHGWVRLPFTAEAREDEILEQLESALQGASVAAVFVEPWQATGGGHTASTEFFEALGRLCRTHGSLLVFDELLTGFYRTGAPFYFSRLSYTPDIVLLGKGLGSGFPVSAVVLNREIPIVPATLPGSTYANNSLAAAAVAATLDTLAELDLRSLVARIEHTIRSTLAPLTERGYSVRGIGAMWVIEAPVATSLTTAVAAIYNRGVAVGYAANCLRLLPSVLVDPDRLAGGCRVVVDELSSAPGCTTAAKQVNR